MKSTEVRGVSRDIKRNRKHDLHHSTRLSLVVQLHVRDKHASLYVTAVTLALYDAKHETHTKYENNEEDVNLRRQNINAGSER